MAIAPEKSLKAIMAYWQKLADDGEFFTKWASRKQLLDGWEAVRFFIGVMLDQRQPADRAWAASHEFIRKAKAYHWSPKTVWHRLAEMNVQQIREFCRFENDEKWSGAFAAINSRKFEGYGKRKGWLRENAQKIIDEYEYVDDIWNGGLPKDSEIQIEEIHSRLSAFSGIGKNLANMAVFSLVRERGYGGGRKSKGLLKIKFDTHVRRVVDRAIISGNPQLGSARDYVENVLNGGEVLESPADFDYAVFRIGQDFCQYDDCAHCPISSACNAHLESMVDELDDMELPVAFLEQNRKCFAGFDIIACEVTCMVNNGHANTFYADEDEIRRHNTGFSVDSKGIFECSLRLTDDGFMFSMPKCSAFSSELLDVQVYPYIGPEEILFIHQEDDVSLIVRIEIEKLDMEK